jgi:ABC-2 type transport system ATP-binding protein
MLAIEARDLVKRYGAETALAGLNLAVPEGTVCGLLGHNGAGKTTAVRILTTLLRPDAGHAAVAGIDVVNEPARAKTAFGLVGQHAAVDEILSGRDNLVMFGRLHHLGARAAARRADDLLARFGLADAATKSVKHYSGGMRRRLDLAAGLITEPRVLFLDEPTTGLDPRSRADIWSAVRDLVATGTTVLLTTQYLEEADHLADRIALLDHGELVAEGTPDDLKAVLGGDRVEVLVPAADRVETLTGVVRALADARIPAHDVAVRRPTLDEVFLHLTATEVSA